MDERAQPTTPDQEHATSHSWQSWLVWVFLLLLVAYPLSTGPVYRLVIAGYLPKATVVIYRPLGPLTAVPFAKACFEWYIFDLWKVEMYR